MSEIRSAAQSLFDTYLAAWNARDFDGVAACFAEPALFVLPQQSVALPTRSALVGLLGKVFEGLEAESFSHTTVGQVTARLCGKDTAIVDVSDVRRLRKDGSLIEAIDGHYVMQRSGGDWRFVVAVACERGWRAE